MDDPRRAFEFRQLDQLDKIRLVLVGFFLLVVSTAPPGLLRNPLVAWSALSFAALYAVFTRFVVDWSKVRSEGHLNLMAGLLVCTDMLFIGVFVWAVGPSYTGLAMLVLVDVVFAAAFFSDRELAIVVGIACASYLALGLVSGPEVAMWSSIARVGATASRAMEIAYSSELHRARGGDADRGLDGVRVGRGRPS